MQLSDKLLKMMEDFMEVVSTESGYPVLIYDEKGYILHSTDKTRQGNFHPGAEKIMLGGLDEYAVTAEEASQDPKVKEGYNCAIYIQGQKTGAFGITGPLESVKPLAKIAIRMIHSWIKELEYQDNLKRSEEKFKSIFHNFKDVYFETTLEGIVVTSSPSGADFSGYSLDEIIGNRVDQLYNNPADRQLLLAELKKTGHVRDLELLFKRKDGTTYDVSINADVYLDDTGQPMGMKGTIRDITDRKIAERKLQKSEEKFRLIFENAPLGILHFNREGIITACNDIFMNIIGSKQENLIGLNMLSLPDSRITDTLKTALKGKNALFEGTYRSTTATKKTPVRVLFSPVFSEKNELDGGIGIIEDVTDRKIAENALIESEKRFRELAELLPETIFETDMNGIMTFVNQKAFGLFGFTQDDFQKGIRLYDLITPKDKNKAMGTMEKISRNEKIHIQEYDLFKKNKHTFPGLFQSSPIIKNGNVHGYRGFIIDITEKKRTQEMLIQNEKILSIGGLAAGMAHEINNPLAGMVQNAQLSMNRLSPDLQANRDAALASGTTMEAIQEYLNRRGIYKQLSHINTAGQQAARLVQNMLNFAKKRKPVKTKENMADILEKTIELIKNDYDLKSQYDFKNIRIKKQFDPDLPLVPCEESKIQQVIMNVIKNSLDATLGAKHNLEKLTLSFRLTPEKKMVCLEIEDNGPGIEESILSRIFEPFFTTKSVDKGTGLGLSISYFIIVDNHNGEMSVSTTPGKGTCFIIKLPY